MMIWQRRRLKESRRPPPIKDPDEQRREQMRQIRKLFWFWLFHKIFGVD